MSTSLFYLFFLFTPLVSAQFYADFSAGYTFNGGIAELRTAYFLNQNTALIISGAFYLDDLIYETFPRIGVLTIYRNKAGNFNLVTPGIQVSGIGAQKELSQNYERNFLRISPFLNIKKPLLRLKGECNCGRPSGLLLELVADLNFHYPFLGVGLRKGFK